MRVNIWKFFNNPRSTYNIIIFFFIISIIFSLIYYCLPKYEGISSLQYKTCAPITNKSASYFDCLYFSITSQTKVGYGDIVPASKGGMIAAMVQVIFGYFYLAFVIAFFTAKKILTSDKFNSFLITYSNFSPQKQTESIKKEVH